MFRLTIRELMLIMVIFALAVGWGIQQRAWIKKYDDKTFESQRWQTRAETLAAQLEAKGFTIEWTDDLFLSWRPDRGDVQIKPAQSTTGEDQR